MYGEQNEILKKRVSALELENQERFTENQRLSDLNEEHASANQGLVDALRIYKNRVESLTALAIDWESEHKNQAAEISDLKQSIEIFTDLYDVAGTENNHLNEEVTSLKNQLSQLKAEKRALSKDYEQSCEARDKLQAILTHRLPITLSAEEIEKVTTSLKNLHNHHKDYSYGDLLTWALATSARNEKYMFEMYNLNDYKKRNPDFLTSKQFQI